MLSLRHASLPLLLVLLIAAAGAVAIRAAAKSRQEALAFRRRKKSAAAAAKQPASRGPLPRPERGEQPAAGRAPAPTSPPTARAATGVCDLSGTWVVGLACMFQQDPSTWVWPTGESVELRQSGAGWGALEEVNLTNTGTGKIRAQSGALIAVLSGAALLRGAATARISMCRVLDWDNGMRLCRRDGTERVACGHAAPHEQRPAYGEAAGASADAAATARVGLPQLRPAEGLKAALCLFGSAAALNVTGPAFATRGLDGLARGAPAEAAPRARDCIFAHPDGERWAPALAPFPLRAEPLRLPDPPPCPAAALLLLAAAALTAALQGAVLYEWFTLAPTGLQLTEPLPALRTLTRWRLYVSLGPTGGAGPAVDVALITPRTLAPLLLAALRAAAPAACTTASPELVLLAELRSRQIPYQVYPHGRRPTPLPPPDGPWRATVTDGGAGAAAAGGGGGWAAAFCLVGAVRTLPRAAEVLLRNGIAAMTIGAAPGAARARDLFAILLAETRMRVAATPSDKQVDAALSMLRAVRVRRVPRPDCSGAEVRREVTCCAHTPDPESGPGARERTALGEIQNFWISECFGMVAEEEKSHGFRYDWVVRLRPDLAFLEPAPSLHNLVPDRVYTSMKNSLPTRALWDTVYAVPGRLAGQFRHLLRAAWRPTPVPADGGCRLAGITQGPGVCNCLVGAQQEPEAHMHLVWARHRLPFQVYPFAATLLRSGALWAGPPDDLKRKYYFDCMRFHQRENMDLPHALHSAGSRWGRVAVPGGNVTLVHHGDWCSLHSCRFHAGWPVWADEGA